MRLEQQKSEAEQAQLQRMTSRKPANPKANLKNFTIENTRMGVTSEVDYILQELDKSKSEQAQSRFDKNQIGFTQDLGSIKKAKEQRYLTV